MMRSGAIKGAGPFFSGREPDVPAIQSYPTPKQIYLHVTPPTENSEEADGSQQDFSKNDVMLLPPGHDAWSVGNEPCVFVEFSRGNDYYTGEHGH